MDGARNRVSKVRLFLSYLHVCLGRGLFNGERIVFTQFWL